MRLFRRVSNAILCGMAAGIVVTIAVSAGAQSESGPNPGETVDQALCRLIESSARTHHLPVSFLTRLIWRESSFRSSAISPVGAQGIAQFMPKTASERGVADPFDPEQAIPQAASLLADHVRQFGNLGLAAAAYNSGPTRVSNWLNGQGELPAETRSYVLVVTGEGPEYWSDRARRQGAGADDAPTTSDQSCLTVVALFRRPGREEFTTEGPLAPWGVQLAGNFSKSIALATYGRAVSAYASIIGDGQPMIIATRLRSRGTRAFYRVRVPAPSRAAATEICNRLRSAGGSCVVLRS